ncbi:MAG: NYN domain-containing protein [Rhodobacteraceae bacterium]|nr:NYN domain-containing protein [Paracoccaceae bacterium]
MKRSGIGVVSRKLRYRPVIKDDGTTEYIAQEKGIDVRLALDLVTFARQHCFGVAIVFSQDQDLAEVVAEIRNIAKEQNRDITLCCPFPAGPSATVLRGIRGTKWFPMDQAFYDACLDPKDYRPRR